MTAPHFSCSILTTAYLPPVSYFFAIAHSDRVLIEQHEAYQKQSWRSRCRIFSAAGPEDLSIPVMKEERRSRPIRDIRIDYSEPWLQHHIRALEAAYNASAGREVDMHAGMQLLELLGLSTPVSLTESFVKDYETMSSPALAGHFFDGRSVIQPKYKGKSLLAEYGCEQAYYQVFVNREPGAGFIPDLSVIDLLSAEGPGAGAFLRI